MLRYTTKLALVTLSWIPVAMTFTEHVAHIGRIEGISMKPTLNPDNSLGWTDFVLIWKYGVKNAEKLHVGDVVLLRSPKNPDRILVKRVLGVEGDEIITRSPYPRPTAKIPASHLWVEGDNVFHSIDSNTFGPISVGLVLGKATHVIFPFKRFGAIPSNTSREARLNKLHEINSK